MEQIAYIQVKGMIINGELKPGDQIIQDQLAKKIGVSRTPLRQAMNKLERDFLLEITNQGIFVRDFNQDFVQSIWEVRSVLEGLACRLAVPKINQAMIVYFRTLFQTAYQEISKGNYEAYREADITFHTKIVEISENVILKQNIEHTKVFEIAFNQGLLRPPSETFGEHMAILDAFENKDSQKAEQLMINHLRKTMAFIPIKSKSSY